jgi:hypothetical protein
MDINKINNEYAYFQAKYPLLKSVIYQGINEKLYIEQLLFQTKERSINLVVCTNGMYSVQEWEVDKEKYWSEKITKETAEKRLYKFFKDFKKE